MMHFLNRFAQGDLRLNRIEAFSDGVFAIVVTLLVLELRVTVLHDRSGVNELGHQLVDLLPKFFSWMISFIIICKFWLNHHHLLTFARHATYGMIWLNSIFLMGQAFIPFPTALMGQSDECAGREFVRSGRGVQHPPLHGAAILYNAKLDQTRVGNSIAIMV